VLRALGENYGHCGRLVRYSASVGAFNPGSGATISGQVRSSLKSAPTPAPAIDRATLLAEPDRKPVRRSPGPDLLEYSDGRPVLQGGLVLGRLSSLLTWEVGELGSGGLIILPSFDPAGWSDEAFRTIRFAGVTDLASIPPLARPLLPPDGPWTKAAVLHHQGYVSAGWDGDMTRKQVDSLLDEAMMARRARGRGASRPRSEDKWVGNVFI
jgi:hypothetical protein